MVKRTICTKLGPRLAKSVRSVTKQVRCPTDHRRRVGGRANTSLPGVCSVRALSLKAYNRKQVNKPEV